MARKRVTSRELERRAETRKAIRNIVIALAVLAVPVTLFVRGMIGKVGLDTETLCPATPKEIDVLLVDVTDQLNVAQKQDFANQFDRLIAGVPRYGQLIVIKVDPVSDRLLSPVIVRCNPGSAADESESTGNPQKVEKQRRENYEAPLHKAFDQIATASGAQRSPILESIQSAALTELQKPGRENIPKRLIIASDLLQNANGVSFYKTLPSPDEFVTQREFRRVKTDLRDVDVELWMLERDDAQSTQPRALIDLWTRAIADQGGNVTRVYRVSG